MPALLMNVNWNLDLGTILSILIPLFGAGWAGLRGLCERFQKLAQDVTSLQTDVTTLKQQVTGLAGQHGDQQRGMVVLAERQARLETLFEVVLPVLVSDQTVRDVLRDAIRDSRYVARQKARERSGEED